MICISDGFVLYNPDRDRGLSLEHIRSKRIFRLDVRRWVMSGSISMFCNSIQSSLFQFITGSLNIEKPLCRAAFPRRQK
ncbi:hypothetical protein HMPREF1554_00250 [Porphyromonas gingivalis F0569]|nr:hypothetical protein HMPREF1554_00250 [Porphyromonas gingivalis F0569]